MEYYDSGRGKFHWVAFRSIALEFTDPQPKMFEGISVTAEPCAAICWCVLELFDNPVYMSSVEPWILGVYADLVNLGKMFWWTKNRGATYDLVAFTSNLPQYIFFFLAVTCHTSEVRKRKTNWQTKKTHHAIVVVFLAAC